MYKDRRRRQSAPEEYTDNQLDQWRWDSHLWADKNIGDGISQMYCEWCKWTPPTEMPLDHAQLCMENPDIKERLKIIGDKIGRALRDSLTDIKED